MTGQHTQCLLTRAGVQKVVWIPTGYARQGCYIKLFAGEGTMTAHRCLEVLVDDSDWSDGWRVDAAYETCGTDDLLRRFGPRPDPSTLWW